MINIQLKKHIGYYIGLFAILVLSLLLVVNVSYDQRLQMLVIVTASLFYALWGIIHHLVHHDLTSKIVIEYILISSLGITLVLFVMKGI